MTWPVELTLTYIDDYRADMHDGVIADAAQWAVETLPALKEIVDRWRRYGWEGADELAALLPKEE